MRAKATWAIAIVALAGCGDIIGLDGYTDAVDGSVDASADTGGGDAKSDAQADASDAGPDAPTCGASSVCAPALPSGWAWAVYTADTRPPCGAGYVTPTDVEEGLDAGAASCGCGCATTQPSCTTGNLDITAGNNNTCDNATTETAPADSGTCGTLTSFSTGGGSKIAVTGPAPNGGSCTPDASVTLPPVGFDHQGRTCALAGDAGASCGAGNVCVPDPAPFGLCVAQAGNVACPTAFPTQHLVGTSVSDTRGCSACTCSFAAGTCSGTATFYQNTSCSMGALTVPGDGTCTGAGNHTWKSYTYSATSSASCTPSTSSPDGGVAFSDVTTICCK